MDDVSNIWNTLLIVKEMLYFMPVIMVSNSPSDIIQNYQLYAATEDKAFCLH